VAVFFDFFFDGSDLFVEVLDHLVTGLSEVLEEISHAVDFGVIADLVFFEDCLALLAYYFDLVANLNVLIQKLVEHLPRTAVTLDHLHLTIQVMGFYLHELVVLKTVLTVEQSQGTVADVEWIALAFDFLKAIRVNAQQPLVMAYILVLFQVLVVEDQVTALGPVLALHPVLREHDSIELLDGVRQSLSVADLADRVLVSHRAALAEEDLAVVAEVRLDDELLAGFTN
jgi:hypothetical protein